MGRLVLTRRVDETIVIDGKIRVTFLGFRGGQARIGIDAPPEVVVDREEVAQRKNAEVLSGCAVRAVIQREGQDPLK